MLLIDDDQRERCELDPREQRVGADHDQRLLMQMPASSAASPSRCGRPVSRATGTRSGSEPGGENSVRAGPPAIRSAPSAGPRRPPAARRLAGAATSSLAAAHIALHQAFQHGFGQREDPFDLLKRAALRARLRNGRSQRRLLEGLIAAPSAQPGLYTDPLAHQQFRRPAGAPAVLRTRQAAAPGGARRRAARSAHQQARAMT